MYVYASARGRMFTASANTVTQYTKANGLDGWATLLAVDSQNTNVKLILIAAVSYKLATTPTTKNTYRTLS